MNNVAIVREHDSIAQFKIDVDGLLAKRSYFIERILPKLSEGSDFYTIKGKKSLGKAGAEKLASIYQLVATFEKDKETIESFRGIEGLAAYICTLTRNGVVMGQGRGAAVLKDNENDPNRTVKMAQKSGFIDSVIRSTGLSDIFTQDLESMPRESIQSPKDYFPQPSENIENVETEASISTDQSGYGDVVMISERQKSFLSDLAWQHIGDEKARDQYLANIDSMNRGDASEAISSFLQAAERR